MKQQVIDCSAQFGGKDAADALLPHFHGFKNAFSGVGQSRLKCGLELLSYIFRVGGVVRDFDFEGCENIELNRRKKYISVDVGVPMVRWKGKTDVEIVKYLASVLPEGLEQMLARLRAEEIACDETAIRALFERGLAQYIVSMGGTTLN